MKTAGRQEWLPHVGGAGILACAMARLSTECPAMESTRSQTLKTRWFGGDSDRAGTNVVFVTSDRSNHQLVKQPADRVQAGLNQVEAITTPLVGIPVKWTQ